MSRRLRAIWHMLVHRGCVDPQDIYRTCAGCWKQLDIREPNICRYQDTERYHFGCEPWSTANEHDLAFAEPPNSMRAP